ncbi:zf-HC2 domain-containing protein [Streptomyces sp. 71268]|uniref:zf-HC2 domain-containing protein n=1 Tax=Streptomyces sp. 71268 TaxID=3002640 RepID=UPI0023F6C8B2|nr:zf-HC2 domain-containing protein [Streptomyces sp. 71268]WEV26545.1 zf-HC2 domain-containing protein [Streptomyces sp. 71268]
MTSTTDTDEHPEVAEISALTEGVLPPDRARSVREHLAGCTLCADVRTSLEEIRSALGTLPGPARMPADIAGRIDAALAAEALLDATTGDHEPADTTSVSGTAGVRETASARETDGVRESDGDAGAGSEAGPEIKAGDVSRETAAEPIGVSRETTPGGPNRPPGRARSTTGPGRQAPGSRPGRGRRWRTALLGTACAAAVLGVGTFLVQNGADDGSPQRPAEGETRATTLTAASLENEARALLASEGKTRKPRNPSGEVGANTTPRTPLDGSSATVPSCVQQATKRPETPLAAREDSFNGTPAYLVLLPHPGDDSRVDAFVVDAACVRQSPSPPGTVLMQRSFARD